MRHSRIENEILARHGHPFRVLVTALAADGLKDREIAQRLGIRYSTYRALLRRHGARRTVTFPSSL